MNLRDQLLQSASADEARSRAAARDAAIVVLGDRAASELENALAPIPTQLDPELAEALSRASALEFSKEELSLLNGLSSKAIRSVLENGSDRDKISAAKLVIVLAKLEKDSYLELRAQSRTSPGQLSSPGFSDPEFIGRVAAAAASFRSKLRPAESVVAEIVQ